jgi:hypothetical protein
MILTLITEETELSTSTKYTQVQLYQTSQQGLTTHNKCRHTLSA